MGMRRNRMGPLLIAAVVMATISSIGQTFAQDPVSFKDKTITIVVGFTPGGTPDVNRSPGCGGTNG